MMRIFKSWNYLYVAGVKNKYVKASEDLRIQNVFQSFHMYPFVTSITSSLQSHPYR